MAGNLPPPSSQNVEDKIHETKEEPDHKRARREEEPSGTINLAALPPPAEEELQRPEQRPLSSKPIPEVLSALQRITSHISNPKKFCKAAELLRQLLTQLPGGALEINRTHGNAVFTALVASMEEDPTRSNDPTLAREYSKLFSVASKYPELFTAPQRAQLDVYGIWAVVLNQLLTTDDSFMFSKTMSAIKEMILDLPVLESPEQIKEEEKALLSPYQIEIKEKNSRPSNVPAAPAAAKEDGEVEKEEEFNEDNDIITRVWSDVAVVAYRRAALTQCIQSAKDCYGKLWARTSIYLLVEHASQHAQHTNQRFLPKQCDVIEEMVAFVREQKRTRKTKGGGGAGGGDATAFERAREDWGKATVSHRGGIGSGGDHKSEAWLG